METAPTHKTSEISKFKMVLKFAKLFLYRIGKRKWFIPAVSEITVDQLNYLIFSNRSPLILDVRDKKDFNAEEGSYRKYGHIAGAMCIPIMELSAHLRDISSYKDTRIVTICPGGGMSLIAAEILVKAGFLDVKSLKGGMDLWHQKGYTTIIGEELNPTSEKTKPLFFKLKEKSAISEGSETLPLEKGINHSIHKTLDARNLTCPLPILKSKKTLISMKINEILEILTTDPSSKNDIPAWAIVSGQKVILVEEINPRSYRFLIKKQKSPLMN